MLRILKKVTNIFPQNAKISKCLYICIFTAFVCIFRHSPEIPVSISPVEFLEYHKVCSCVIYVNYNNYKVLLNLGNLRPEHDGLLQAFTIIPFLHGDMVNGYNNVSFTHKQAHMLDYVECVEKLANNTLVCIKISSSLDVSGVSHYT